MMQIVDQHTTNINKMSRIMPQVISSSDNFQHAVHRHPGNIAVRRNNLSSHIVIVEARRTMGAVMTSHMQEIADALRELERSKIKVHLQLFIEQMTYQREKDRRIYKNAAIANDNSRLTILKQREMVSCLSQLSIVLSSGTWFQSMPQAAPHWLRYTKF